MRRTTPSLRLAEPGETVRPVGATPVSGGDLLTRSTTGDDLVQWLDLTGGPWTARATELLVHQKFLDTIPIRTSPQYQNRRNRVGWYAWTGRASHVWFESGLEMESLVGLDQRGDVAGIASQSMRLLFGDGSPCISHVPDFFALLNDGTQVLVDVKPSAHMNADARSQFAETSRVCAAVGWRHEVMHESTEVRRRNLALLREFRHPRCHPSQEEFERALDIFEGGRIARDGATMLNLRYTMFSAPVIAHLAWHRFLDFDWEKPFGSETDLRTTSRGTACCRV